MENWKTIPGYAGAYEASDHGRVRSLDRVVPVGEKGTRQPAEIPGADVLLKTKELIRSGYAGVLPNGNIVDRREHPDAVPVQKNALFGTPAPKEA